MDRWMTLLAGGVIGGAVCHLALTAMHKGKEQKETTTEVQSNEKITEPRKADEIPYAFISASPTGRDLIIQLYAFRHAHTEAFDGMCRMLNRLLGLEAHASSGITGESKEKASLATRAMRLQKRVLHYLRLLQDQYGGHSTSLHRTLSVTDLDELASRLKEFTESVITNIVMDISSHLMS